MAQVFNVGSVTLGIVVEAAEGDVVILQGGEGVYFGGFSGGW